MGEKTAISWCDHTFNPWIGCMKVSPACDGCYAENLMATRYKRVQWGAPGQGAGTRERTSAGNWSKPRAWDRKAAAAGTRPFVFCASLADVFDNQVDEAWRIDLFNLIAATPHLVWLLLTKRPQNIVWMAEEAGGLPPNVALGTTAEDQERWDLCIPELAAAKAATGALFTFASCEPLLRPIDPTRARITNRLRRAVPYFGMSGHEFFDPIHPRQDPRIRLDWIITGGETDQGKHRARPSHPKWFRDIRDACERTGTPYHHKQNGEWAVASAENGHHDSCMTTNDAVWVHADGVITKPSWMREDIPNDEAREPVGMFRMGAAKSGRLLDGVLYDARPAIRELEPA